MRLANIIPDIQPFARVLYVDDFRDVADTAVMVLSLLGFDARAAYDGPSALRLAATFEPRVCFLDLNMPGMEGDELAVKLRGQAGGRSLVLVAITAMGGEATVERLVQAGFHFHLQKPVDPQTMLAVLRGEWGV